MSRLLSLELIMAGSNIYMALTMLRPFIFLSLLLSSSRLLAGAQVTSLTSDQPLPSSFSPGTLPASSTTATATVVTTVVSIFYINVRGEDSGMPYTLFHRVGGSVIGADDTATTYAITATLSDQRRPTISRTDNVTTNIPTLRRNTFSWHLNQTQKPSIITQGPSTFLYTGSNYGPNRTLINRCQLNGTTSATCNLTHVGGGWYTQDAGFNGTYSTYNYSWTPGDRFGFAPVTITDGVEKMPPPTSSTSSGVGGAPRIVMLQEAYGLACAASILGALIVGIFAVL
jgi:hypothetical protein